MTNRVRVGNENPAMPRRHQRRIGPGHSHDEFEDQLRHKIARNLFVDPELIQYAQLESPSKIGITGSDWQVFWRGQWRQLPWHFDGPTHVTWTMIRRWHGI